MDATIGTKEATARREEVKRKRELAEEAHANQIKRLKEEHALDIRILEARLEDAKDRNASERARMAKLQHDHIALLAHTKDLQARYNAREDKIAKLEAESNAALTARNPDLPSRFEAPRATFGGVTAGFGFGVEHPTFGAKDGKQAQQVLASAPAPVAAAAAKPAAPAPAAAPAGSA